MEDKKKLPSITTNNSNKKIEKDLGKVISILSNVLPSMHVINNGITANLADINLSINNVVEYSSAILDTLQHVESQPEDLQDRADSYMDEEDDDDEENPLEFEDQEEEDDRESEWQKNVLEQLLINNNLEHKKQKKEGDKSGGGMGGLSEMMGPIMGYVAAGIGAFLLLTASAGAGYLIYKYFVEPMLDEMKTGVENAVGINDSNIVQDVKTSTGEKVFKSGDGEIFSESELNAKIENTKDPASKKKFEDIKAGGNLTESFDAKTGLSIQAGSASMGGVTSGMTLKEMKTATKDYTEKASADPSAARFQRAASEIVAFDQAFRARFSEMTALWQKDGGVIATLVGGRAIFEEGLESLLLQHQSVIDRLRGDPNLSEEQKLKLEKDYSPMFEDAIVGGSDPDVDNSWILGYDMPNGEGAVIDWSQSETEDKKSQHTADLEFGPLRQNGQRLLRSLPKVDEKQILTQKMEALKAEQSANTPKAAKGAFVTPTSGGSIVNVAEGGKPEIIHPLGTPEANNAYDQMANEILKSLFAVSAPKTMQDMQDASVKETTNNSAPIIITNNNTQGGSSTKTTNINSAAQKESSSNDDPICAVAAAGDLSYMYPS